MKLKFCGAARSVTGSCYKIQFDGGSLLVDCGMRQGADKKTELGEDKFPFNPAEIDAVLLTHAHIDHSGLLPLLVKQGFKGPIYATEATTKLAMIMLPDSGHIQEQEAEYQSRKNVRAGKPPVQPLYSVKDAQQALTQFKGIKYEEMLDVLPGIRARFIDAGHLLGSSSIEVWVSEQGKSVKLAFSGDIGRDDRPIIADPKSLESCDCLLMEGTYGDRNHAVFTSDAKEKQLINILKTALVRGGNIVIPSFAVGRTQEMLYYIKILLHKNAVPGLERVPVYIDSPLGINATKVYEECAEGYYDEETKQLAKMGSPFDFPTLRVAQTADESKLINTQKGTNIIISSSGMCDAGRIRHHLKHNLYRADSTIVFTGYQAQGTLGRMLLGGVKKVKLFGEEVRVNATIEQIEGFSGHAGRDELIEWLQDIKQMPKQVFLVHGENSALESLSQAVASLGYKVEIPQLMEEIELSPVADARVVSIPQQVVPAPMQREGLSDQLKRISALVDAAQVEDMQDARFIEEDLRALADKWNRLLQRKIS